ncbi:putative F-box protein At3g52320 isoform X1 [Camellia sinensis]|nr:putative F-box protein At3g52320 isoform X1 [Camellia sinensis]
MTISCSQSKNQKNDRPFLSEDMFFHILILLPAAFLHDCGRYVCKAWAKIIRDPAFIKAHLLQSKGGLFIQKYCRPYPAHFLELKGGEFKETSLNRYFPGQMVSSSGGLSLFCGSHPQKFLYVGNYVTMQYESLPFPIAANELFPACHIAFIPHTGEYKVVCHCVSLRGVHRWLVLTVGKNMLWRKLETPLAGNNLDYVEQTSVTIGGVLYWSQRSSGIYAIDLCDESSYSIQVPNEFVEESYWLLELGHRLSCLVNHQREIHVCILKDMHRSEWDKLYKVREVIDTQKFSFRTFIPVGWMDNGQLLIFIIRRFGNWKERLIGAYNVKTGETKAFNDFDTQLIHLHTNGLASW